MFEKEIAEIKTKYNNSIEITNKLKELYKNYEYGGSERTNIFYLDIHINETAESIKKHAFDAINQIIKYWSFCDVSFIIVSSNFIHVVDFLKYLSKVE